MEKLSIKLLIWIIAIICILAVIFSLISTLSGWIIIIVAIIGYLAYRNHKNKQAQLAKRNALKKRNQIINYRKSLAPTNWTHWIKVPINSYDCQTLGQTNRPIHYMFIDSNSTTTFPESQYGNDKGYYVIDIHFQPRWIYVGNSTGNGTSSGQTSYNLNGSQNTFGGGAAGGWFNNTVLGKVGFIFGSHSNTHMNGSSISNGNFGFKMNTVTHQREVPSNAIITLVTSDLSQSFKIKLMNVNSNFVETIRQYYLLDSIKKHKLGI